MQSLIYLLRHGAIDTPSPRRFLGQSDLPLNATGINQAKEVGRALAHIPFCRVFSSPLIRAMHTAALVSGRSYGEITAMDALKEIDLGRWEGLTVAEIREQFPGSYEERGLNMAAFRPHRGESFADVAARALPALETIGLNASGPVLVVAHAGVNRAVLCSLQSRPLEELLQIPQDYCAVNILAHNNTLRIEATNRIFY